MKRVFVLMVLGLAALPLTSKAQNQDTLPYVNKRLQIGTLLSDFFVLKPSFDISYRYMGNQALGFQMGGSYGFPSLDDQPGNTSGASIIGQEYRVFQKIYLKRLNWDKYFYIRHGVRYSQSVLSYDREEWYPFEINGNTHLNFETRSFEEIYRILGYEAMIGMEVYQGGLLFIDLYIGAAYLAEISTGNTYHSSTIVSPIFSGIKPNFGVRVAAFIY